MNTRALRTITLVVFSMAVFVIERPALADDAEGPKIHYKDGFYIDTSDGKNTLHIQGRLQSRFTFSALDDAKDTDTFAVQRGELRFEGNVFSKQFKYGFETSFSTRAAAATTGVGLLNDYYFDWQGSDAVCIKAGQFKVPYLLSEQVSAMKQEFPDRSLTHDYFTFGRDLGVDLHGALFNYFVNYNLFVMNGDGQNTVNTNKGFLLGARIDVPLFGAYTLTESDVDYSEEKNLLVGLAYVYDERGAAFENASILANVKASHGTADVAFRSHGFSLQGAGMVSRTHEAPTFMNWGYNVQSGYFFIPKHFEIAARAAGAVLRNGIPNQYEYGTALNYYFNKHNLKLQTDYALIKNARGTGLTDHRVRTQLTVVF